MEEKLLEIKILTSEETLFEGSAQAVFLPGVRGPFEVLPRHAPLVSLLEEGSVRLRLSGGEERSFTIPGGVARVFNNRIALCVEG